MRRPRKGVDNRIKIINDTVMHPDLDKELRYLRLQAKWTRPARVNLYRTVSLVNRKKILDVGCADGFITSEIAGRTRGEVLGFDISEDYISAARSNYPEILFEVGDFLGLPFGRGEFDAVITNFTLMWVGEPLAAVKEALRVLKKGGVFLATGEPDYGGRIDWPPECNIGQLWTENIQSQGGDPFFGRRLKECLVSGGLKNVNVEVGVFPSLWEGEDEENLDDYLDSLKFFFRGTKADLDKLIKLEKRSIEGKSRLVFLPIFWGMGEKG
jgi:SAM-dependent methyltransferase